ncbi:hypothetical protein WSK_3467 [Novosphingobium sp. Rr 2-17]|uniref:thermonuclease family protein n=1 Tax=Novosphingobium sp. Rr 2-17 TaxID=555793 RepID=UPI0002699F08|nr:thermonuclease family protein [Novosphingobium sp. Rr 2-17]EIZ77991.1 hypothetical protein WSK_3467 [Novosphingobium sp. Rr 2-17]
MPIPFLAVAAAAACIASVHDGDTVRLCSGERIRLVGIDAPERPGSPRCTSASRRRLARSRNPAWCDYRRGEASRVSLQALLARGGVTIVRTGTDRYGRTLARLSVNGQDAGAYQIQRGYARIWR